MPSISKHHRYVNVTAEDLLAKFANAPTIFLPPSIKSKSLNHFWESTSNRSGFELNPPWETLPLDLWKVSVDAKELEDPQAFAYNIQVVSGQEKVYTGDLKIAFKSIESDTEIAIIVDGSREAKLEAYSDDLIETIIRSLIRESCEYLEQTIYQNSLEVPFEEEPNHDHMAPLAVAAGVFSAGMALGLWFWRRKRKA